MELDTHREQLLDQLFGGSEGPEWVHGRLLRSGEVAELFQVSRRAVNEWARTGKLPYVTTLGGHRRFPADKVRVLLTQSAGGVLGRRRAAREAPAAKSSRPSPPPQSGEGRDREKEGS